MKFGESVGDVKVADLRVVTLYFIEDFKELAYAEHEYVVHKHDVDKFVAAAVALHGPNGRNPHQTDPNVKSRRVSEIRVNPFIKTGPFWWTTPDLQKNDDPAGAAIYQKDVGGVVWRSPTYEEMLRKDREEEMRAEQEL